MLAQMPLPRPFSLERLIAAVEAERGRRIKLVPIPDYLLAQTDVCGLCLQLKNAPVDLIFFVDGTTAFHRLRIILHELAHLWCDDDVEAGPEELAGLIPDFPSDALRGLTSAGRVMARHRYDSHAELRAEMLTDLLLQEAYATDYSDDATLRHLDEDFSLPRFAPRPRAPWKNHVRR
ncbi:hypothetical protein F9278_15040 [Streptomyces phaeolivaceus]|uniref:Toxin n=1 Tax=Streptomyces phaeolivaceus TaxID=2653200 RepID=A0A5P8K2P6_9ACTN|nr:hypothetical protein [Streptomyces phaeolivaceus]QFQ97304.1 hypothetical protein F9278_15040 [Streptomyces phaeolivaceus]